MMKNIMKRQKMAHLRKIRFIEPLLLYGDENEDVIFQAWYLIEHGKQCINKKSELRRGLKNQYPSANIFKIEAAIQSAFKLNNAVNWTFNALYSVRDSQYEKAALSLKAQAPCLTEKAYSSALSRTIYFLVK